MIGAIYRNRLFYYQLIKDFLSNKINAFALQKKFLSERNSDIDRAKQEGFFEHKIDYDKSMKNFRDKYTSPLYNCLPDTDTLFLINKFIKAAIEYNVVGEEFFQPLYDDVAVDIRDFYPRNKEEAKTAGWEDFWDEFGFPELSEEDYREEYCIDETELRRRVQEKFKILEENKERWI